MENKEIELKNFEDEYMIKVKGGKYVRRKIVKDIIENTKYKKMTFLEDEEGAWFKVESNIIFF